MRTIQSFDPSAATSSTIVTQVVNPCSVVVLFNHSQFGLTLTLPGGNTANLPPWYFRYYYLPLPGNIDWKQSFQLSSSGAPVSKVTGEVYEPSEAESRTFTEGPLPLQTNVGNTVATTAGSANTLQNDNNASGTQIIESTFSGSPQPNVYFANNGDMFIQQYVNATLKKLFESVSGSSPMIYFMGQTFAIDGTGHPVLNNNTSLAAKDSVGGQQNILNVDTGNNLNLKGIPNKNILQFLKSDGTVQGSLDLVNALISIAGTKQTVNGDTSGTMDVYEFLSGPIKLVVLSQSSYRQAGTGQLITLKTAFTIGAGIFNFGAGGIVYATGGSVGTGRQITWGTGTSAGSQNNNTQIPQDAAGFSTGSGFTQVGDNGGYASSHSGLGVYVGI